MGRSWEEEVLTLRADTCPVTPFPSIQSYSQQLAVKMWPKESVTWALVTSTQLSDLLRRKEERSPT